MIRKITTMIVLAATVTACSSPVATAPESAVTLSKTNWNGVKLDASSVWISDDATYLGVDFTLTGLGNNRSADVTATASNVDVEISCVKTYRNGRTDRTRTRTLRNWRGTGRFPITQNGQLTGVLLLDKTNADKQAFCSGQGSGWNYDGSAIIRGGTVQVILGDRNWTIN